ncbi:hypothetical protein [Granulicella sp. S190]|uniref:hypothetical protein n=1 Tax=Granulicella sp. S190 TaxID=1747226 RepID=UPI00131ECD25|nr:hypothetical protein [Granulicella sp. S190]
MAKQDEGPYYGSLEDVQRAHQVLKDLQNLGKPKPQSGKTNGQAVRSIKSTSATALVAAYITRHAMTLVEFAEKAHIDEKTLRRLLHTTSASARTWAEVAKAMRITTSKLLKTTGL